MISVIIPIYNGEGVIADCLESLLNQNYPKNKYEIIVVDDGSTDNTVNVVSKFKGVKLIRQKHRGPAAARNLGVKKSKGNIVLFTDADCVPSKNWIKNMLEPFKNKEIVGVAGTYKTLNKKSLIARFVGYEITKRHEKLKKKIFIDFIATYSAAYRKNIFLKFNGFDEEFTTATGEDPELSFKINKSGYKMVFQPEAFVYHRHPNTLLKLLRKKFWTAYWRVLIYEKHKDKMFRHSYTPKLLFIEEAFLGTAIILLVLGFLGFISIEYGMKIFAITFLLTLPFAIKIFLKDKIVGLLSPVLIILRNLFIGLGIVAGILNILYKKLK